jgi:hypothetical protein
MGAAAHVTQHACGHAGHDRVIRDIPADYCSRAYQRALAHHHAADDSGITPDRGPGLDASLHHLPVLFCFEQAIRIHGPWGKRR